MAMAMIIKRAIFLASLFEFAASEALEPAYKEQHRKSIAYLAQGKHDSMLNWVELQRNLAKYAIDIDFYLLTYDKPLEEGTECLNAPATSNTRAIRTTCLFVPKTTWTEGRNLLVREVGLAEWKQRYQYKYWVLFDEDATEPFCAEDCKKDCCFNDLNRLLMAPMVNYAAVGCLAIVLRPYRYDPQLVHYGDCVDACMHAIHRDAVPLLLPYVDYADFLSWTESQAVQFQISSHCLPGTGVMYPHFRCSNNAHSGYPTGRFETIEYTALKTLLAKYPGSGVEDVPFVAMDQGDCANTGKTWEDVSSTLFSEGGSEREQFAPGTNGTFGGDWQHSERYNQCIAPFGRRFNDHLIAGGKDRKARIESNAKEKSVPSQYAYEYVIGSMNCWNETFMRDFDGVMTPAECAEKMGYIKLAVKDGDIVQEFNARPLEVNTADQQLEDSRYKDLYVIVGGHKHKIPDEETFRAIKGQLGKVRVLGPLEFYFVPRGNDLPHATASSSEGELGLVQQGNNSLVTVLLLFAIALAMVVLCAKYALKLPLPNR